MPKNRIIIILGACVALLPLLGFPKAWESFFQIVAGLSIITLSVWSTIDRKLSLKAKAQMRQGRKVVVPEVAPGVAPLVTDEFGKRVTDFYPKTGQSGRRSSDMDNVRSSDIKSTLGSEETEVK